MHLIRKCKGNRIYWIIGKEEEYADITIEKLLMAQTEPYEGTFSKIHFKTCMSNKRSDNLKGILSFSEIKLK